eukprot:TRINITY_DN3892_c0_g1_i5.p2 TRINITY_DN3892_c0_g1~~TRINITY_DN3892_c0_g1_i5.p2  ORF type:complete len:319 (-),score=108.48 TRINITY_DN3892_c0_g1_i5:547-1503(-)
MPAHPPPDGNCCVQAMLQEKTNVLMKRQKLIGLSINGKPASDETPLTHLSKLKNPHRFILMGTPEADIFVDPQDCQELPEVFDDFDLEMAPHSEQWRHAIENSENLARFTEKTEVHFIHQPREGKRLLVLDLDHTLLDFSGRSGGTDAGLVADRVSLKRPHMDAFLTAVYAEYDLAVWSQTSWRWLELKLTELGLLYHPAYKISFVLDKTSMFHVTSTDRAGKERRHQVKPLHIIWRKFPHWTEANTYHVDDLGRNFALNPANGIKVKAYYRGRDGATRDDELVHLAHYLLQLAAHSGPPPADHKNWRGWKPQPPLGG